MQGSDLLQRSDCHAFLDFAKKPDFARVRELIEQDGRYVNAQPDTEQLKRRFTALHQACCIGDAEMVEYLLAKSADPTMTVRVNATPKVITHKQSPATT